MTTQTGIGWIELVDVIAHQLSWVDAGRTKGYHRLVARRIVAALIEEGYEVTGGPSMSDLPEPERVIPLPDQTEPEDDEDQPALPIPNAQVQGDEAA